MHDFLGQKNKGSELEQIEISGTKNMNKIKERYDSLVGREYQE